jgi:hypothetical protein
MKLRPAVLALALSTGLFLVSAAHTIQLGAFDFDELWHLATGRLIVETHSVPDRDPFTFTAGDTPWINTNWLAQVVFYRVFQAGGLGLDCLLGAALLLGAVVAAHAYARSRTSSGWAPLPSLFLVFVSLRTASSIRPQGWTFLLLPLALVIVERLRAKPGLAMGSILASTLALSLQLHGGFVFVFGAVGLVLAGEAWDLLGARPGASRRFAMVLGAALVAGVLGFTLHPQGIEALLYPFRYSLDPRIHGIFKETNELSPPALDGVGLIVAPLLIGMAFLALTTSSRWRTSDALLLLAFGQTALATNRGVHYLALVTAGPLAAGIGAFLGRLRERARGPAAVVAASLDALEPGAIAFGRAVPFVVATAVALVVSAQAHKLKPGVLDSVGPGGIALHTDVAQVASYLLDHPEAGRLWNEMEVGGALDWFLWPHRRIFFDGRGDLHGRAGTWPQQSTVFQARDGWEEVLERWNCELAVAMRGRPIETALRDRGWRVVLENDSVVLFVKPGSATDLALLKRAVR